MFSFLAFPQNHKFSTGLLFFQFSEHFNHKLMILDFGQHTNST